MAGSGPAPGYEKPLEWLRSDLAHIQNIETRTRRDISSRLDRVEEALLEIFTERALDNKDEFLRLVFKCEDREVAAFQIQQFFYGVLEEDPSSKSGFKATFYATKDAVSEDFFEFSNLVAFKKIPEIREFKLRDPAFHAAILGITPAS